jgi:hypothetical protein
MNAGSSRRDNKTGWGSSGSNLNSGGRANERDFAHSINLDGNQAGRLEDFVSTNGARIASIATCKSDTIASRNTDARDNRPFITILNQVWQHIWASYGALGGV